MLTSAEIKDAIAKLGPDEARELAAWFDDHLRLIASSDAVFRIYDEEEDACRTRVAEKSG